MELPLVKPVWCSKLCRPILSSAILRIHHQGRCTDSNQTSASFLSYDPDSDILRGEASVEEEPGARTQHSSAVHNSNVDISELIDFNQPPEVREMLIWRELETLSNKRLRCICRSYGLILSGNKRDLIERIFQYEKTHECVVSCWRKGIPPILHEFQLH